MVAIHDMYNSAPKCSMLTVRLGHRKISVNSKTLELQVQFAGLPVDVYRFSPFAPSSPH